MVLSPGPTMTQAIPWVTAVWRFSLGIIDEIPIDLVPLLLGDGVRLFEHLGVTPTQLEQLSVIEGMGVTHLQYRVVK